ncbi:MAG: BMP family protein [Anaerolineales bacterium]|nr:BMP family protein [Anaerolineales bacterium]MDW8448078.1 BMP family protein [Anaerolineales bacterium]
MVFPGAINDKSWNQAGFTGLERVKNELGVETAYLEQVPSTDWEEALRTFASQGYSLVLGHGDQFSEPSKKVAPEFPATKFIVVNGAYTAPNLASIALFDEQVSFLAGVVAAKMSQSGKVGYIGGLEIPPVIRNGKGFEQGAKYVNPDIQVSITYLGDFNDAAKGKEAALAMAENGVDVIFYYVDNAMLGIQEAAKGANVKLIGCIFDQYEMAPDLILTSAIQDISTAIFEAAKTTKEGKFEGKAYLYGLDSGAIALAPFRENVPAEVAEFVKQVQQDILSGKIKIERISQ